VSDSIAPALTMVVGTDASMQTHGRASTRVYTQHVRRTRLQEDAHCLWRGCAQPTLVIDRRGASKHTLFLCHRRASHAHPLLNKHAARACARARQRARARMGEISLNDHRRPWCSSHNRQVRRPVHAQTPAFK